MGQFRAATHRIFFLSIIALFPSVVQAQCPPLPASPKSPPSSPQEAATSTPEFFDQPQFTVAGVTDASTPGGHGSDTVIRTKEALAKDTAALGTAATDGETEKSLRAALEHDPTSADLHHSLGDVEEKSGNPLEAVREYQRAAELKPSEPNLFDWGTELLLHRAFEPATEVFTRGNQLFPASVRMLVGLGVALYDRGAYGQAAQRLCQASDLNPADPNPYLFMGKIQAVDLTPPEGMGERLERFVRLQPEDALANYYYAVSVWQQRKGPGDVETLARAESLLQKAVHLDPKLAPAYLQLGILYAERKDWRQAIVSYQEATKADPQLEEAHYRLAQAYRQTGEKAKAEQELELHAEIKKKTAEQAERERREIREFVYTLRNQYPVTPPQSKP
jgi:tetratricopeptide (TPR) repeat protein